MKKTGIRKPKLCIDCHWRVRDGNSEWSPYRCANPKSCKLDPDSPYADICLNWKKRKAKGEKQ